MAWYDEVKNVVTTNSGYNSFLSSINPKKKKTTGETLKDYFFDKPKRSFQNYYTGGQYSKLKSKLLPEPTPVQNPTATPMEQTTNEAKIAYLKERQEREKAGGTKSSLLGSYGTSIYRKKGNSILGQGMA